MFRCKTSSECRLNRIFFLLFCKLKKLKFQFKQYAVIFDVKRKFKPSPDSIEHKNAVAVVACILLQRHWDAYTRSRHRIHIATMNGAVQNDKMECFALSLLCSRLKTSFSVLLAVANKFNSFIPSFACSLARSLSLSLCSPGSYHKFNQSTNCVGCFCCYMHETERTGICD